MKLCSHVYGVSKRRTQTPEPDGGGKVPTDQRGDLIPQPSPSILNSKNPNPTPNPTTPNPQPKPRNPNTRAGWGRKGSYQQDDSRLYHILLHASHPRVRAPSGFGACTSGSGGAHQGQGLGCASGFCTSGFEGLGPGPGGSGWNVLCRVWKWGGKVPINKTTADFITFYCTPLTHAYVPPPRIF